jgi:hypothetical protein
MVSGVFAAKTNVFQKRLGTTVETLSPLRFSFSNCY